ncbi:MAG TPA: hypothetical protein VKB12_13085 [Pyrinomonadaceae bacterium]|nr:hypothetical protein [Pyrinomonadaceae bacterium]
MKFVLALVLGVLVGGAGAYFLFVGAPRAHLVKGEKVSAPEPGGPPPGTAVVELDEQFFGTLLSTIFRDLGKPAFPLQAGSGCPDQVVIEPDSGGVRTGVTLQNNQVTVPLAFSGGYNMPLFGCQNFRGTAEANLGFNFVADEQALNGSLTVVGVNMEGMSPLMNGPITAFVQGAINQRVNPIPIMRGQPLTLNVPVQATGGTLQARARDVRAEVRDGKLRLHVTYDFKGQK